MEPSRRDFGGLAAAAGVAAVVPSVSVSRGVIGSHVRYWQACTDVLYARDRAVGGTVLLLPTLQAHHAAFDWQGIAACLEASDERTLDLYLRHGYTDHEKPIELPDGPSMYPMVRIPGLRPQRGPAGS